MAPFPDQPDQARVAEVIPDLAALPDDEYAETLGDAILAAGRYPDPQDDETEDAYARRLRRYQEAREDLFAFRSPELAGRSLAAAQYLIDRTNAIIARTATAGESHKAQDRRRAHFRDVVGRERRILQQIVDGLRAQRGIVSNAPNPRQRAYRELARRHPEEYLSILRGIEHAEQERRRAERAGRRAARKDGAPK